MSSPWSSRAAPVLLFASATCVHGTDRCLTDSDCNEGHVCLQDACVPAGPAPNPSCLGDACDGSLPVTVAPLRGRGLGRPRPWALLDRAERWGLIAFGDVTGDGRADLVAVERSADPQAPGTIWVAPAEPGRFGSPRAAGAAWCPEPESCRLGDVDGDGRADLVPVRLVTGAGVSMRPMVLASSGGSSPVFETLAPVAQACLSGDVCLVGDVDGDGRADLVAFMRGPGDRPGAGNVLVARAGLSGFGNAELWHPRFCIEDEDCHLGDVDGDRRVDIVVFAKESPAGDKALHVAFSTGTDFREEGQAVRASLCAKGEICAVADIDGDKKQDFVVFGRGAEGVVWRLISLGRATPVGTEIWGTGVCLGQPSCHLADVAGGGIAQPISVPALTP